VHAFHQGVDGDGEFAPGRHRDDGGIVTNAFDHVVAMNFRMPADTFDQVEFHAFPLQKCTPLQKKGRGAWIRIASRPCASALRAYRARR
jgi:hypothetical protein